MADYWQLIYAILAVALLSTRAVSFFLDTRELELLRLENTGDYAKQEAYSRKRRRLLARRVGNACGIVVLCIAISVTIYLYRSQQQESTIALSAIPGCAHLCIVCIDVRLPLLRIVHANALKHCVILSVMTTTPSVRLPAVGQACFAFVSSGAFILGSM